MRDTGLDLFRCICMLGVVCIHSFSWNEHPSQICWALSNPSLIGFVMISAWFGIHFNVLKVVRFLGTVAVCIVICAAIIGKGGVFVSWDIPRLLVCLGVSFSDAVFTCC